MYLYWAFTDPFLIVTPSTAQWNSHSCAVDFAFGKAQMILNTSENVYRFSENTVPFYVGTTASKYLGIQRVLKPIFFKVPGITKKPSPTSQ